MDDLGVPPILGNPQFQLPMAGIVEGIPHRELHFCALTKRFISDGSPSLICISTNGMVGWWFQMVFTFSWSSGPITNQCWFVDVRPGWCLVFHILMLVFCGDYPQYGDSESLWEMLQIDVYYIMCIYIYTHIIYIYTLYIYIYTLYTHTLYIYTHYIYIYIYIDTVYIYIHIR